MNKALKLQSTTKIIAQETLINKTLTVLSASYLFQQFIHIIQ